jgi:predicted RNase H-like HicB family nuclease
MTEYAIGIFFSDEDGAYIAVVPDLRGCSAFGDAPEDALREVLVAKDLWIESAKQNGDPLPEPRYRPPARPEAG